MAKFFYRMQNILDVNTKLETQAKNEFAVQSARVAEEEQRLAAMEERSLQYKAELKELSTGELDTFKIKEKQAAIDSMKYVIDRQKVQLAHENRILEEKRIALSEARQEVRTHEKLKEKQFLQFMAEEAAKESKEIDELVSYRFGSLKEQE